MSTPEDLRADADREAMLDRCDGLHADAGIVDPDCPGCAEREQIAREDADADG